MALHPRRRRHMLTVQGQVVAARYRVLLRPVFWAILLLLTLTGLALTGGFHAATPIHAAPLAQPTPTCDTATYHGVKHCIQGDVHTIIVDLADPHVRVQTVLPINTTGAECNSVNPVSKDPTSNCADPYPFETLDAMLARYKEAGAVAAINTDYFGCGAGGTPCGGPTGDHGAQGLAVRNGVRLDGPPHGVTNDLAYTTPSLAVSPLNLVTIGIPGSQAVINNRLDNRYYNTVGGSPLLIKDRGAIPNPCAQAYHLPYGDTCNAQADADGNVSEAQSAAAISDDGKKLVLATAGLQATALADYLVTTGPSLTGGDPITSAIKFDGGGSARLAWRTQADTIAAYSPTGQNRPIAQALLIFSDKITTKSPGIFPPRLALAGAPGLSTTWALTVATGNAPIDKGDVMLVFDRTGSMEEEIAQAQVEYSNGNRLFAADRFFTDAYAKAGVRDSATGFAATSMINFAPSLTQPNAGPFAMPQTTNLFSVSNLPPTVSAAIAFAQGTPLGLEIAFQKANRCQVMAKSPAAMFFALRAQLQAGNPPLISLFNAEPTVGRAALTPERTLLPYRIEEPTLTSARVFVYDPAYPGSDTQVVEFSWTVDRTVATWRYATADQVWQGDHSACRLTVTPLSLFTHQGVAWWKVGPSWPPAVNGAARTTQAGGGTEQPPAVQLYHTTGPVALLITDREGQRLGVDGTTFYDEIPGATFVPPRGDLTGSSGLFYVPRNSGATAQLRAINSGDSTLKIFGDNALQEVTLQGVLSGTLVTVVADEAGEELTVTALNNAISGRVGVNRLLAAEDRTVQIGNLNLQPNSSVHFTFRPASPAAGADEIVLQSTSRTTQTVSLSLQRSGERVGETSGYTVFGVDSLPLSADATLALQLDSWTAPTQVTAVITNASGNVDTRAIVSGTLAAATVAFEPAAQTLHKKGEQLPLTITVRDRLGAYVADGTAVVMQTTRGNLAPTMATTVNGRVTATLTYEGSPGAASVTAQVDALQATLAVTFLTPTALPDEQEPTAPRDHHTYLPFVQR